MKTKAIGWRIAGWLLLVAWLPVLIEVFCNYLFHVEERFPSTILVIPYLEFVTGPLTCLAAVIGLYKGLRSAVRSFRTRKISN
jgi:hypothetical protein